MDAGDALTKGAQIAVAFAGLTAVVFVRRGAVVHAWPKADKFRLMLLLTTSILPFALCLLGLLLLGVGITETAVWRWCSGIAAVLFFTGSLLYSRTFLGISKRELRKVEASRLVYWTFSALGIALGLLQIYNAAALGKFWPVFTFIVASLLVSIVQFLRLILTRSVQLQ
ncbi:MAG: hypothetical protein KGL13_10225 [Gammaproteobacteria bacterium]|nr:hypothetical protein [Gammaproteobacteria bacterium]MDE2346828.1 hypothetical protein [Gammaproteobacteria bacterium]